MASFEPKHSKAKHLGLNSKEDTRYRYDGAIAFTRRATLCDAAAARGSAEGTSKLPAVGAGAAFERFEQAKDMVNDKMRRVIHVRGQRLAASLARDASARSASPRSVPKATHRAKRGSGVARDTQMFVTGKPGAPIRARVTSYWPDDADPVSHCICREFRRVTENATASALNCQERLLPWVAAAASRHAQLAT